MIKHINIRPGEGKEAFKDCKLGREPYADILTDIISGYSEGFVLALNNEWGAGKTTFINMWREKLNFSGFHTLYYNAWENDFEKDVLVALISELSELQNKPEKEFKKVLQNVLPLAGKVLPSILKHLAVRYTGDEAVKDIAEAVGQYTEDQLKELTNRYKERKQGIIDFKTSLSQFVEKAGEGKPLVFFIDELDRCRPNYAVEVLEEVKHLFSVSGIVFVLSIDKVQLGHAVRGVYGSEKINSEEYLRRFIDLEYSLPDPPMKKICEYLYSYYGFNDFLGSSHRLEHEVFRDDKYLFIEFSSNLFYSEKLNFRQTEKIFALARVALKSFSANNFVFPSLYIFLVFLKTQKPELFNQIKNKSFPVNDLLKETDEIFLAFPEDENICSLCLRVTVELACGYNNYYFTDQESRQRYPALGIAIGPTIETEDNIPLHSALDRSPDGINLKRQYERLRYQGSLNFSLSHLLNKIQLLEPLNP